MGAEELKSRVTPDITRGNLARQAEKYILTRLLPPSLVSSGAQGTIIALEKKVFGEVMHSADWLKGLPVTDKLLGSTATSLLMLGGAFLGEMLVKAKREIDLEPESWLPKVIWHGSIATQFASAGASIGKVAFGIKEIVANAEKVWYFAAGDIACAAGGVIALADNFRPRSETGDELKDMIWPTIGMVNAISGFMLAPIEDKPKLAGFCVASIANFVENACEINWRAAIANSRNN